MFETLPRVARGLYRRFYNGFYRFRLSVLRSWKGGTLWLRRGDWWLPFHGDGDLQEVGYLMNGTSWFKDESERLHRWLPRDGVVVDAGANLGFMVLLFSGRVGPGGKVFAFEPSPIVFPRLEEVIEKNALQNVRSFNLGCGTAKKTETLVIPKSSGNASIKRNQSGTAGAGREVRIEIDSLDSVILPLTERVDFLKIDTEGFEDQVLAGAEQLISRFLPVIYIELSQQFPDSSRKAIEWLAARDYVFDREPRLDHVLSAENFLAFPPSLKTGVRKKME
jgi:FkbM family methyltransferase